MTRTTLIQNKTPCSLILGLIILIVFFAVVKKANKNYSSLVKENRDSSGSWLLINGGKQITLIASIPIKMRLKRARTDSETDNGSDLTHLGSGMTLSIKN